MRFTLPLIATAATLILAPAALADTTVSVEGGNTLYVRDTPSLFDERMDVVVTRSGTSFEVTDAVGNMHAKAPCVLSGAAVKCPANTVTKARLQGGTKNDVISLQTALPATWYGDKGDDELNGGPARDVFQFEPGRDEIDGRDGIDEVTYADADAGIALSLANSSAFNDGRPDDPDRVLNVENAIGSAFEDTIVGSVLDNLLSGTAGPDTLRGGNGDDILRGDDGDDNLRGEAGNDLLDRRRRRRSPRRRRGRRRRQRPERRRHVRRRRRGRQVQRRQRPQHARLLRPHRRRDRHARCRRARRRRPRRWQCRRRERHPGSGRDQRPGHRSPARSAPTCQGRPRRRRVARARQLRRHGRLRPGSGRRRVRSRARPDAQLRGHLSR